MVAHSLGKGEVVGSIPTISTKRFGWSGRTVNIVMLEDIQPYNAVEFRRRFINTQLYQQLTRDFDEITFSSTWEGFGHGTPRQHWADRSLWRTKFSAVPFYYLEFLTQQNPKEIYDLGCGWNVFKRYIPNIRHISYKSSASNI